MAANLLAPLPDARRAEVFTALLQRPGVRIERIVSQGQVTPPDMPYDQPMTNGCCCSPAPPGCGSTDRVSRR